MSWTETTGLRELILELFLFFMRASMWTTWIAWWLIFSLTSLHFLLWLKSPTPDWFSKRTWFLTDFFLVRSSYFQCRFLVKKVGTNVEHSGYAFLCTLLSCMSFPFRSVTVFLKTGAECVYKIHGKWTDLICFVMSPGLPTLFDVG